MIFEQNPLAIAADALETACEFIDKADVLDETLRAFFDDAKLTLESEVDKRLAFDRWTKIQVQAAQEAVAYYEGRIAQINEVREAFKEKTQKAIEANPGVTFRGKLGKIWVQKHQPGVSYAFGSKDITPEQVLAFGVPGEYVKSRLVYWIDSEKLKADLLAGKTFPWASLYQGASVRFTSDRRQKIEGEANVE